MKHWVGVLLFCSVLLSAIAALAKDRVVVVPLGGKKGSPAPVAKTGQTSCYNSSGDPISCDGTGQDGELQKGVAWPVPRFTDSGDGTVTDNLTGLIWLKNADCIHTEIPNYDKDLTVGDGRVTRQHALDFVAGLNLGTIRDDSGGLYHTDCGDTSNGGTHQSDWRLPNRFELESLLDIGQTGPALPAGHPFINVALDYFWTSSYESYYVDLGIGWAVHFSAGAVQARSWNSEPCHAWPVRGGK